MVHISHNQWLPPWLDFWGSESDWIRDCRQGHTGTRNSSRCNGCRCSLNELPCLLSNSSKLLNNRVRDSYFCLAREPHFFADISRDSKRVVRWIRYILRASVRLPKCKQTQPMIPREIGLHTSNRLPGRRHEFRAMYPAHLSPREHWTVRKCFSFP